MKVITFSRYFPKGHPRAGESTFFPEKIILSLGLAGEYISTQKFDWMNDFSLAGEAPKSHTIRQGNRWKAGEKFSARIWSGKPYASKQIEFAQIEIKKVWNIDIELGDYLQVMKPKDSHSWTLLPNGEVAKNDGLAYDDFVSWFNIDSKKNNWFHGQIICWNENINYE